MKLPVQIQFHGLKQSAALEQNILDHAEKLESFFPNIIACRVTIEWEQKRALQGRPFHLRIDLTVPGHELVVNRVRNEDVHVAMRDAFDDMQRQLEDLARKRRGQKKLHPVPLHGEVVRLDGDAGYGFIRTPDGNEYYFSRENLANTPYEHIQTGTSVQFLPEVAGEGLQAKRVSVGKHAMG
jgi:ribosome-associated translation inhibitor RaiA/cold shock CspA family protein